MEDQSYHKGLATGVSDGTVSGERGVKENYRRKANVQEEANKLGNNLMAGVAALFLHPVFCFVGFWLVCFGSLLALAPVLGISRAGLNGLPGWYAWVAAGIPLVPAFLLRKIIPRLMAVLFFTGLAVLAVLMVMKVMEIREEREARASPPTAATAPATTTPATRAPARTMPATRTAPPRRPTAASVRAALRDAARSEVTSVAPGEGGKGKMFEGYDLRVCDMSLGSPEFCQRYCATLATEKRPEWCH